MRPSSALVPFFALFAVIAGLVMGNARPKPAAGVLDAPRVKLAVLVVFDQMRGDFPEKWKPLFGPSGFVRMQTEGATFTRCYYPYGTTSTGPGHASMLTGTCPDRHGIVNNNWFERGDIYCAADPRYSIVPTPKPASPDPKTGVTPPPPQGGTPERMLSESVADVLKASRPGAKVFGLSLKDRSAILPTGKTPDGAFWFAGRFVTSTYYTERVGVPYPKWVTAFNASGAADRWFGKDWTRFRTDLEYTAFSGPDDGLGEGTGYKQGKTFPHPTTGGLKTVGKEYYEAMATSPYGNDLLLEFTKACIREEKLGQDAIPDLLVVSFSSNDLVGHAWGPDSHEVLDITLRSDALMADLLGYLDTTVGKGSYVLAITADHGICPLPEFAATHGHPGARRVNPDPMRAAAEKHLKSTFGSGGVPDAKGKSGWIEEFSPPWFYLNPKLLAATGRNRDEVGRSLADFLLQDPETYRAFTREELKGDFPPSDEIAQRAKRAYYPERCGDVYLVQRPYCLLGKPGATGTTHGSPHGYDAHVPLMVIGPGIPGGSRSEPTTPQAAAAILSHYLGVRPPADADFPVPSTLESMGATPLAIAP